MIRAAWLLWTILLLTGAVVVQASDEEQRLLAGLRSRRLFQLAAVYCQQRLADQSLSDRERAEVTAEWIRVTAEDALNQVGESRDQTWQTARQLAADYRRDHSSQPHAVLVRLQDALTVLALARLERMEAEVSSVPDEPLAAARGRLREAAQLLKSLDEELRDAIPAALRNPLRPDSLGEAQLTALQHQVRLGLAGVYENQALCYPESSSDRTASLTAAVEMLQTLLRQLDAFEPLAHEARLQQVVCLRLLGDLESAGSYLAAAMRDKLPPAIELRFRAEQIRLLVLQDQSNAAMQLIGQGRRLEGQASPELDFAILEAYIRQWKSAVDGPQTDTDAWRDKAVATAEFITQQHGQYWGRRAERLLVRIGQSHGDASVAILRRAADELYRKGRHAEAADAYEQAARGATEANDEQAAFELTYKAALVQQEAKLFALASNRFRQVALGHETHPHASRAHLAAIINARQAAAEAGVWPGDYPDLLREHLARWPDSPVTVGHAAFWLGEWESSQQLWPAAVVAFRQVPADQPNYVAAVAALAECWARQLAAMQQAGEPTDPELQQATEFFQGAIGGAEDSMPANWTTAARTAAVCWAKLQLQFQPTDAAQIERILRAALRAEPAPDSVWAQQAASLLVLAVAWQGGRDAELLQLLQPLDAASSELLVELLAQAGALRGTAEPATGLAGARLQLAICQLLEPRLAALSPTQRRTVQRVQAAALAATGALKPARDAYAALAAANPSDGDVQEGYAQLLLDGPDRTWWEAALDQWRLVAARSQPRTYRWFRAKYAVAMSLFKLGDRPAAAKLIRYLQATEDLGQSGLKTEFEQLLRRCE